MPIKVFSINYKKIFRCQFGFGQGHAAEYMFFMFDALGFV